MFFQLILLGFPLLQTLAVPLAEDNHNHDHNVRRALPSVWYHPRDHSVHDLFGRATDDGFSYPTVGSPQWSAGYPQGAPNPATLPAKWIVALNAAVASGKIPNIPQSSNTPNTNPVYPSGSDPTGTTICSATYKCRIPGDVWDSPDGVFASSFDDGPSPLTPSLVKFLGADNETTTHFMIGVNILYYPSQFLSAFNANHDIAVHTWTHPYMTTLSNLQIVGELGYTMQLIHNSTGGRLPKYWRPPYGDSDTRVRSIALEVFGLTTVVWNQDTEDWDGTPASIGSALNRFLTMPKSPGLIVLEHEIANVTVNAFMTAYPTIKANGWNFMSLAKAIGDGRTYQNAQGSTSNDVQADDIVAGSSPSPATPANGVTTNTTTTPATTNAQTPTVTDTTLTQSPTTARSQASSSTTTSTASASNQQGGTTGRSVSLSLVLVTLLSSAALLL